jgi:hypothetical protein
MSERSSLLPDLLAALSAMQHPLRGCTLQALPDKGLAHDHVRLVDSGWLARIPKQSQMGLDAVHNLAYQRACFERAAPGGHTPRLHSVLPPSTRLPRGALLVQEIVGRPARLPQDLGAIVTALAALHALPLPAEGQRAPLQSPADPLRAMLEEITEQSRHLGTAQVAPAVAAAVADGLQRLKTLCADTARPSRHLIAFDGHPGNFIVRADGEAVLVDLEKCRYSHPGLDLAHATLYTSTTWDVATHAVLSVSEVAQAYRVWHRTMGLAGEAARTWHLPLRRAMWLWSLTWCAKWRVLARQPARGSPAGEDWSAERSDRALVRHVRDRVDHYLSAPVVERVLAEFDTLDRELRA